jgi:kynurenine formamidase
MASELCNWGRWGSDDERGTLNHITAERIVAAARLITEGVTVSLGIAFDGNGPQPGGGRTNPLRVMTETGSGQVFPGGAYFADDYVIMPLQAGTQWDALGHVWYGEQIYNGFPASGTTVKGLEHGSIDKVVNGFVGRGVLLDAARWHGRDWLEIGTVITPADLDRIASDEGVTIKPGDILLIRTGWWRKFINGGSPAEFNSGEPGLSLRCASWLHEHEVAAVAADNFSLEVMWPGTHEQGGYVGEYEGLLLPLHMLLLRQVGMMIGEIFDLEALGQTCERLHRYEFFFTGPPLKFTGGAGSPTNPLALF